MPSRIGPGLHGLALPSLRHIRNPGRFGFLFGHGYAASFPFNERDAHFGEVSPFGSGQSCRKGFSGGPPHGSVPGDRSILWKQALGLAHLDSLLGSRQENVTDGGHSRGRLVGFFLIPPLPQGSCPIATTQYCLANALSPLPNLPIHAHLLMPVPYLTPRTCFPQDLSQGLRDRARLVLPLSGAQASPA